MNAKLGSPQKMLGGFLPVCPEKPGQSEEIKKAIDRNRDFS
jgi:hypothetical protein